MEEENKSKNKNKIIIVITLIILIIALIGIGFFVYMRLTGTESEEDFKYTLTLYKCDSGSLSEEKTDFCTDIKYQIKTENQNSKYLSSYPGIYYSDSNNYDEKYIIYSDNGLKIYDVKNQKSSLIKGADTTHNGKYSLIVNKNQDDYIGILYEPEYSSIEMTEENSKYYDIKSQKYIEGRILSYTTDFGLLLEKDGLQTYNFNTRQFDKIELENNYNKYTLNTYNGKVVGISYYSDENNGYYNVLTKQKMYENKYGTINAIDENYLRASSHVEPAGMCSYNDYLLSANKEEIVMKNEKQDCSSISIHRYKDNYILIESNGYLYPSYNYYTEDKKIIIKDDEYNNSTFDSNGNLYVIDNNTLKKYNIKGELIDTDTSYEKLLGTLYFNYVVYLENNTLKVKNLDDDTIINITEWKDNYEYAKEYSLVTNNNKLFLAIYFKDYIDKLNKGETNFDDVSGIEYYYDLNSQKIETKEATSGYFTYQAFD